MRNITLQVMGLVLGWSGLAVAQEQRPLPSPSPMVREVAPQLYAYTQDVLFGQVWRRGALALRDRSIVTLSSLLANGQSAQMTSHINLGLDNGLKPSEIVAIITHSAFYAGWPNAMSAVGVARAAFEKRGIALETIPGSEALVVGANASATLAPALLEAGTQGSVAAVSPQLAAYTREVVFGNLWQQPELSLRDRSLVTISMLIAKGQLEDLPLYLDQGMDNGLSREQITEAITHLAFYAGWPRAMSAVPIAKRVFDARSGKE